ncbi:transposase family protein [Elizabethkingia anophelis]|uniref:transposase family protein n=1 Tax=Elizabethkingia anophelis TaxID=1117645 RepID=UPI000D025BB7|nr:transposase family protein [Elizabethkingia anophelis]PRQ84639.1 hypothetical protein CMT87_08995 [Elizabethkingia anophelis]PRQ85857.1 hypothetical protein CMT86_14300 [Elizabethkingia anophelis]
MLSFDNQEDEYRLYVQSRTLSAICPNCCTPSKKIHSCYTRKIADLPVFGKISVIFLRSRKFYCRQAECPYKVFSERFEHHFKPYRRKTDRLESKIQQLGLLLAVDPPKGSAK